VASAFRRKSLLLGAAVVLAIAGAIAAWTLMRRDEPIPFTRFTLDNGLRVILAEDHSAPTVAVAVTYDVGSKDDPPGRDGLAHLFEHMLFNGSLNVGKGEHQYLISRQGGSANGAAFVDQTHLWQTVPSNQLDLALFLEADRMRSLRLDQARLDTERNTLLAERQQRVENVAYGRMFDNLFELAYDVPAYKKTMVGTAEGIRSVTLQEVNDFFRIFYSPNNAVLTIAGDFDPGDARTRVENYFQHIPAQPPPPRLDLTEAAQPAERRRQVQDPFATTPVSFVAYKIPPGGTAEAEALAVLSALLADGASSRLHQKLIKERGLASAVGPSLDIRRGPGLALIVIQPIPGRDEATVLKAFDEIVADVRDNGVTDAEVTRGRTRVKLGRAVTLQQSAQRAVLLNEYEVKFGGAGGANRRAEWLEEVTPADVQRVARQYFVPERRTIVTVVPGGTATPTFKGPQTTASGSTVSASERLNRAPVSKDVLRVSLPAAKESTLDNGVTLLVAEDHRVPLVAVRFEIRGAGTLGHAAGRTPIPIVAGFMLREGTASRTSRQISEEFDTYGATMVIGQGVDPTMMTVQVTGLSDTFGSWFPVIADLVTKASFPADELTLMKQRLAADWRLRRAQPGNLASEWYDEVLYQSGATTRMKSDAVEGLTSDQLAAWHKERYVPQNTLISIVGAIDEDRAREIAQTALGGWQRTGSGDPPISVGAPTGAGVYIVDRPGSVQTTLVLGVRTVDRAHADQLPLTVANRVLGGGPAARLFVKLRDERGLTYNVSSQQNSFKHVGDWRTWTDLNSSRLGEGVEALLAELKRLGAEPVPEQELDDTKRSIVASFALTLEQLSQVAYYISSRRVYGLSNDYWQTYPERLMALSAADVQQAAAKYMDFSKLQVIAVGDAKQLEPLLKPLGPVTVIR
jgi:zinc protease